MSEFLVELAETCTKIINDPESNINLVSDLLKINNEKEMVYLSLAKVFKSVAPLYKIRLINDKIKHKSGDLEVSAYDKNLFNQYNLYIKEICASNSVESFLCSSELLKTIDHFNFADRLVSKVLLGSNFDNNLGLSCLDTLVDRIKNDLDGDTVFLILNQCLDYKHNSKLIEAALESKYLEKCVQIRINKEEKYNKAKIESDLKAKKNKKVDPFFKYQKNFSSKQKKEQRVNLSILRTARKEERDEMDPLDEKNYIRNVNALQRLYFTILKKQDIKSMKYVMQGIVKYFKIIRKEFHEGLYTLLCSGIKIDNTEIRLEGILTILTIYGKNGYDFKNVLDSLYQILDPMNFSLEITHFDKISKIIKMLFIDINQPIKRVIAITQRMMLSRCFRIITQYEKLLKDLRAIYDIEYEDHEIKNRKANNPEIKEIDKVIPKPYYEYSLYKKVL